MSLLQRIIAALKPEPPPVKWTGLLPPAPPGRITGITFLAPNKDDPAKFVLRAPPPTEFVLRAPPKP